MADAITGCRRPFAPTAASHTRANMPPQTNGSRTETACETNACKPADAEPKPVPVTAAPHTHWLVAFDLALSTPLFELRLPPAFEWLLSVPGSIFGMPVPMTIVPLAIATTADDWPLSLFSSGPVSRLLLLELLVFAALWAHFIPKGQIRTLCKTDHVLAALVVGNLYAVHTFSPAAFGRSAFWVGVFSAVVGIVAPIKQYAQRLRPNFVRVYCQPRHLPIGPTAVQSNKSEARRSQDQHAAFPSGDAASCAALCTTVLLGTDPSVLLPALALCTVTLALCCLGRMYWRHHHFLDVLCGSVVGAAVALGLYGAIGFDCTWKHVLLLTVGGAALNEFTTA